MTRPPRYPRARWFSQRRNRRGRPVTVRDLDAVIARVLGSEVRVSSLATRPDMIVMFRIPQQPTDPSSKRAIEMTKVAT